MMEKDTSRAEGARKGWYNRVRVRGKVEKSKEESAA